MALTEAEKIRKAEEIYYRRNGIRLENNHEEKKKSFFVKFLKKVFLVIIIVCLIYGYQNRDYLMSESFKSDLKNILNTQIDMNEIMNRIMNIQTDEKIEEPKEKTENTITPEAVKESTTSYTYIMPIDGIITSEFGLRESENENVRGFHTGIDIAADLGQKIISSSFGKVIEVSGEGGYGNHLKIENDNIIMLYAHCNDIYVSVGDIVTQGEEIAEVGLTGNTTGPHLHFEIRKDDCPENPMDYINKS